MKSISALAASDLSLPPNSYVYSLLVASDCLSAISSDDSLRAIDLQTLDIRPGGIFEKVHNGVTCLKRANIEGTTLATGGRDGTIRCWDLRSGKRVSEFSSDGNAPITSLDCNTTKGSIAAGTEFVQSQAAILIWDIRNPKGAKVQYVESHNDDITELQYHPSQPSLLLSGSTDGLVNIYNTNITEEDDALYQIINHGSSIHHAGFVTEVDIFAISHDESLTMYNLSNPDEGVEDPPPTMIGDVRAKLDCEYVGEVLKTTGGAIIGAGNHSKQHLDLIPLKRSQAWCFDKDNLVRLVGAHGDEIVRSICVKQEHGAVYTGGEDGQVRLWLSPDAGQDPGTDAGVKSSMKARDRKAKDRRYMPY